ncbi:response regulator transcription factor [Pandoraea commovens]|uniref:Response regulator protein TmoT n=1 Tax=Pandoraea commovens TaxID=2508289 RepID=A0A5E4SQY3_9BURK|nr:response regulator [Pandoraea commovens]VVD77521.1 Response regulator protein TmoT [Pandoraea commovens]
MPPDTLKVSDNRADGPTPGIVYVVDDDAGVRRALATLMRSVDLQVETFASAQDFLAYARPDLPSCLVLDVRLRGTNGLTFHRDIVHSGIKLPVVFITGHGDIEMSVKAMKGGAADFFAKPFRDQDMIDAITQALVKDRARIADESSRSTLRLLYESLSTREKEVMTYVLSGLLNKQIAAQMGLSEITVKVHRGQLMRKMLARSIPDLVRKAELLGVQAFNPAP